MKIRSGFVSNSSSSSFVLAYDKTGILTNPKDIVEYVDAHPRKNIMFISDLADGWDVFELDMKQKNYLLRHKKRFIKYNQDPVKTIDWEADVGEDEDYPEIEIPAVTAYTKVLSFYHYPHEYETPEVDMSDIEEVFFTLEEAIAATKDNAPEELRKRADRSNECWRIREERERAARKKQREDFIEEVNSRLLEKENILPENLVVKIIEVDNDSCDPDGSYDSEFATRYFGLDEDTYYEENEDPELFEEKEE